MTLRINNNISALSVQHTITRNISSTDRQIESPSSGLRVDRASSDASGVVISEGFRSQLAGLSQNLRNTEQASDLLQVAEGSLGEASKILLHMRALAARATDGSITEKQREVVASSFNQARETIDLIAQNTTYNETSLLAGASQVVEEESSAVSQSSETGVERVQITGAVAGIYTFVDSEDDSKLTLGTPIDRGAVEEGTRLIVNFDRLGVQVTLSGRQESEGQYEAGDLDGTTLMIEEVTGAVFQIGPDNQDADRLEFNVADLRTSSNILNLNKVSVSSQDGARRAFAQVDLAITHMANERGRIGALQNRLAFSLTSSENELENMQASDSTIRDADVAQKTTEFSRSRILRQSSMAMLVQAFDISRLALQLL